MYHLRRWYCVQVSPRAACATLVCGACSSPPSIHLSTCVCVVLYSINGPLTCNVITPLTLYLFGLLLCSQFLFVATKHARLPRALPCNILRRTSSCSLSRPLIWQRRAEAADSDFLNVAVVERSPTTHFTRPPPTMITESSLHVCICACGWKGT